MNLKALPGAEFILPGLNDLYEGENNTIGALLVAIAQLFGRGCIIWEQKADEGL